MAQTTPAVRRHGVCCAHPAVVPCTCHCVTCCCKQLHVHRLATNQGTDSCTTSSCHATAWPHLRVKGHQQPLQVVCTARLAGHTTRCSNQQLLLLPLTFKEGRQTQTLPLDQHCKHDVQSQGAVGMCAVRRYLGTWCCMVGNNATLSRNLNMREECKT